MPNHHRHSSTLKTKGLFCLASLLLTLSPAMAEKMLVQEFNSLFANFGKDNKNKIKIIAGPEDVAMGRGQSPGKVWIATSGKYQFKLTIENKVDMDVETLVSRLQQIPLVYRRAYQVVSQENRDGIAVYANLDGAAAHGGKEYINIIPSADARVIAHEIGHTLEQVARDKDPEILNKWAEAVKADNISVSKYGDSVNHEDLAEFAMVYAACLDKDKKYLDKLKQLSPQRFNLWTNILYEK